MEWRPEFLVDEFHVVKLYCAPGSDFEKGGFPIDIYVASCKEEAVYHLRSVKNGTADAAVMNKKRAMFRCYHEVAKMKSSLRSGESLTTEPTGLLEGENDAQRCRRLVGKVLQGEGKVRRIVAIWLLLENLPRPGGKKPKAFDGKKTMRDTDGNCWGFGKLSHSQYYGEHNEKYANNIIGSECCDCHILNVEGYPPEPDPNPLPPDPFVPVDVPEDDRVRDIVRSMLRPLERRVAALERENEELRRSLLEGGGAAAAAGHRGGGSPALLRMNRISPRHSHSSSSSPASSTGSYSPPSGAGTAARRDPPPSSSSPVSPLAPVEGAATSAGSWKGSLTEGFGKTSMEEEGAGRSQGQQQPRGPVMELMTGHGADPYHHPQQQQYQQHQQQHQQQQHQQQQHEHQQQHQQSEGAPSSGQFLQLRSPLFGEMAIEGVEGVLAGGELFGDDGSVGEFFVDEDSSGGDAPGGEDGSGVFHSGEFSSPFGRQQGEGGDDIFQSRMVGRTTPAGATPPPVASSCPTMHVIPSGHHASPLQVSPPPAAAWSQGHHSAGGGEAAAGNGGHHFSSSAPQFPTQSSSSSSSSSSMIPMQSSSSSSSSSSMQVVSGGGGYGSGGGQGHPHAAPDSVPSSNDLVYASDGTCLGTRAELRWALQQQQQQQHRAASASAYNRAGGMQLVGRSQFQPPPHPQHPRGQHMVLGTAVSRNQHQGGSSRRPTSLGLTRPRGPYRRTGDFGHRIFPADWRAARTWKELKTIFKDFKMDVCLARFSTANDLVHFYCFGSGHLRAAAMDRGESGSVEKMTLLGREVKARPNVVFSTEFCKDEKHVISDPPLEQIFSRKAFRSEDVGGFSNLGQIVEGKTTMCTAGNSVIAAVVLLDKNLPLPAAEWLVGTKMAPQLLGKRRKRICSDTDVLVAVGEVGMTVALHHSKMYEREEDGEPWCFVAHAESDWQSAQKKRVPVKNLLKASEMPGWEEVPDNAWMEVAEVHVVAMGGSTAVMVNKEMRMKVAEANRAAEAAKADVEFVKMRIQELVEQQETAGEDEKAMLQQELVLCNGAMEELEQKVTKKERKREDAIVQYGRTAVEKYEVWCTAKKRRERVPFFFQSVQEGNVDSVRHLVEYVGIDVNVRDRGGNTALHLAAEKGDLQMANVLLLCDGINMTKLNGSNCTPFQLAARNGHIDMLRLLLKEIRAERFPEDVEETETPDVPAHGGTGADAGAGDAGGEASGDGVTPTLGDVVVKQEPVEDDVDDYDDDAAEGSADGVAVKQEDGEDKDAADAAAGSADDVAVKQEEAEDKDAADAAAGSVDAATADDATADDPTADVAGEGAIIAVDGGGSAAAAGGGGRLVRHQLQPLLDAEDGHHFKRLLHFALKCRGKARGEAMMRWLLQEGAPVDALQDGQTPLQKAAYDHQAWAVEVLLEHEADVAAPKKGDLYQPLHFAVSKSIVRSKEQVEEQLATITLLLEHGRRHGVDLVNAPDKYGYCPFHYAAWRRLPEALALLLKHGADTSLKTSKGKTALDLAEDEECKGLLAEDLEDSS